MSSIAIIPARGGSKRVPKKNAKIFLGKPIIAYSIETALESGLFDRVVVSTDDPEIKNISEKYGAEVLGFRADSLSNDYVGLFEVIEYELSKIKDEFEFTCCLFATAPFVKPDLLQQAFNKLKESDLDMLFPIVQYSSPIERSLKINKNKIEMVWPEHYKKRSQDFEQKYHDAGQFYYFRTQRVLKHKMLYCPNSEGMVISTLNSQDIDNLEDWKLAELKYSLIHSV